MTVRNRTFWASMTFMAATLAVGGCGTAVTATGTSVGQSSIKQALNPGQSVRGVVDSISVYQPTRDMLPPAPGTMYVAAKVTLTNKGQSDYSYNPMYFELKDPSGNMVNVSTEMLTVSGALQTGTLAPGGTVTGVVGFEVPTSQKSGVVMLQTDLAGQKFEALPVASKSAK
ncbi:DUF4352 domain-containing protein [Alicyclobacillus sp. ALC3]|uniref:DUF4352 domain-containing protein n=1 Tax=Alicyclobacillus sp. ALC3 TaxID=2796143 RepID=UPI002377F0A7|nr:DUF4352 domain-containing protein [Alicyclobacillus sp. ALC3]WDL99196.1 DUF4352 domain-containing protein [Alicyclobacillus sp. ALC3]